MNSPNSIGVHDDFFAIGGHSLLLFKLTNEIEKITGKKLSIPVVFRNATIAKIAYIVDQM